MRHHTIDYDAIVKLTSAISQCKDTEKVAIITAKSVQIELAAKGCSIFLVDRETKELGLIASHGLSPKFLDKGPIHFMQSINEAKDAMPIAIYDVMDDPRIEYPEKAKEEGIASMLGVPIISHNNVIGALRIYTEEPWKFSINDIAIVQAIALICGMAMEMCWIYKDHETKIKGLEVAKNDEDAFGLGSGLCGPQTMNELLKNIRGLKIPKV